MLRAGIEQKIIWQSQHSLGCTGQDIRGNSRTAQHRCARTNVGVHSHGCCVSLQQHAEQELLDHVPRYVDCLRCGSRLGARLRKRAFLRPTVGERSSSRTRRIGSRTMHRKDMSYGNIHVQAPPCCCILDTVSTPWILQGQESESLCPRCRVYLSSERAFYKKHIQV